MNPSSCPGQDKRYWKPDDIFEVACPHCGKAIELWKDDSRRVCARCGETIPNPRFNRGCATWCAHAEHCALVAEPARDSGKTVRDRLIAEMKRVFGADERCVGHALAVLAEADELLRAEGGDPLIVTAAAILHDIGIHEAEAKYGSAAGHYQEIEGPPIARQIMESLGLNGKAIEHVCAIVATHHSGRAIDTLEFRILWDADWLVNLAAEPPDVDKARLAELIVRTFRTPAGCAKAHRRFLEPAAAP